MGAHHNPTSILIDSLIKLRQSVNGFHLIDPVNALHSIETQTLMIIGFDAVSSLTEDQRQEVAKLFRGILRAMLRWSATTFGTSLDGSFLWWQLDKIARHLCLPYHETDISFTLVVSIPRRISLSMRSNDFPHVFPMNRRATEQEARVLAIVDKAIHECLPSSSCRAVATGLVQFGWVDSVCIVVAMLIGISKEELGLSQLSASFGLQQIPILNSSAVLVDIGTDNDHVFTLPIVTTQSDPKIFDRAREIVDAGTTGYDQRMRRRFLAKLQRPRGDLQSPPRLVPSQSISQKNVGMKGSFGVFVRPKVILKGDSNAGDGSKVSSSFAVNKLYGVTAYHLAVPTEEGYVEQAAGRPLPTIVTPAVLDIQAAIQQWATPGCDGYQLKRLVNWVDVPTSVGRMVAGNIGADLDGWREDWTLVELDSQWTQSDRHTTQWWDFGEINDILNHHIPELFPDTATPLSIRGQRDPILNEYIFKDGATTSTTVGVVGAEDILLYHKRTALKPAQNELQDQIDVCRHSTMWPFATENSPVAYKGDSGSACFGRFRDGDGVDFVGMLVSIITTLEMGQDGGRRNPSEVEVAMFVPATRLMQQMETSTGVAWEVSGAGVE